MFVIFTTFNEFKQNRQTGLVVYQDEQLVTSMGGKGARKQGGESLLQVERKYV